MSTGSRHDEPEQQGPQALYPVEEVKRLYRTISELRAERDQALAELERARGDLKGPDHHETWKDAAVAERVMRVAAQAEIERLKAECDALRSKAAALAKQRDNALEEIERIQAKGWPSTAEDVRGLLGSSCAAVRYALPVPDGASEAPPHDDDEYVFSAHDLITCNFAASGVRYAELEEAQAEIGSLRAALARAEALYHHKPTGEQK